MSAAAGVVGAGDGPVRVGGDPGRMDDGELVVAIGLGVQAALAEAYGRHGGAVWALARRVCRDDHLSEDVCQTVFAELWSRPDRFDPDRGSLRSWLMTQAHARAVDLVRAESARRRRQDRVASLTPVVAELETAVYADELADGVRSALATLPAAEREPILLAYFGGHTYREAAEMLGQPEGTVKSRIRAGLGRLRLVLEGEGITS